MARFRCFVFSTALLAAPACMQLPEQPDEPETPELDASLLAAAAEDGGGSRPPTGAPYTGPECDPPALAAGRGAGAGPSGDAGVASGQQDPEGQAGTAGATAPAAASAGGRASAGADGPRRPSAPGDLVITELMSNPEAVRDDAGEWFELYNPSADQALDLQGCAVNDGAERTHAITAPMVIAPGAFAAIARGLEAGFAPALTLSFSLGNTADVLALECGDVVIDRVAYGAGFPLVPGASMALDPDAIDAAVNDDASAWCAAQRPYSGDLGTPGAPNADCDHGETGGGDADAGSD
jgi:hypothetical protein